MLKVTFISIIHALIFDKAATLAITYLTRQLVKYSKRLFLSVELSQFIRLHKGLYLWQIHNI